MREIKQKRNCGMVHFFYEQKMLSKGLALMLTIAILNLPVSCSYFNVRSVPTTEENKSEQIKAFNESRKYVIIHSNDISWNLDNMVINEDDQTISGIILPVNDQHQYEKIRKSKRVHSYNKGKSEPLNEVHLMLKTSINFQSNASVSIPLSDIASMSVNDKNTGRTIANILLTTVGAIFVLTLIALATKSSCPFVYVKNGEEFDFVGELYPGIITANMQKDDYLPLPNFSAENGQYTLKIANHLKEIQHTDFVQLISVTHEKNVEVLIDSKGELQSIKNLISPVLVTQDDGLKNKRKASKKDNEFYGFDTSMYSENSTRNVIFDFNNPLKKKSAKLYLTAKNSVWLDYIFGKFNEQFGSYYNKFQRNQQKVPFDTIQNWSESQHIPLSIYLKTNHEWKLIEKIKTVGPMAMRNIVVPLTLENVERLDKIQIKLETGFMFWEVDYVGIDYSKNIDMKPIYISPSNAIDQYGNDVTLLLNKPDENYFSQPNIGDEAIVNFQVAPCNENQEKSIFLHNRGYYNYIRDYKGVPDIDKLKSFKEKNTFTRFSEDTYFDFVTINLEKTVYHE